jgi:hypothetical protein
VKLPLHEGDDPPVVEVGDDGGHHEPGIRQLAQGVSEGLEPPLPRRG